MEVYLDNSATTRPSPVVVEAVHRALTEVYANPSSLHHLGLEAEHLVKAAREQVASAIVAAPEEIYFTSGGTEANNLAIFGAVSRVRHRGNVLVTTAIEHPSVLNVFKELEREDYHVIHLRVDRFGLVDLEQLAGILASNPPIFISVMGVNNELGTIEPIAAIGRMLAGMNPRPIFHVDAVQALGKIPLNVRQLKIDLLSMSSHKIHGLKGTGALFVKKGTNLRPLLFGGGQESGLRSGTENVPGIAGMGVAAAQAASAFEVNHQKMRARRDQLAQGILAGIPGVGINSPMDETGAPHILNVSFEGIRAEVLLHALEEDGIYVSTVSACSSRKKAHSHVLQAAGLTSGQMEGAIRFSFSVDNSEDEIEYVIDRLSERVAELRRIMKGW